MNGTAWKGDESSMYTEDDFAWDQQNHDELNAYMTSKCLQENECIKYLKENKDREDLTEIVTLHPTFIIGPPLNHLSSSSLEGVQKMVGGSLPVVPRLHIPSVDVRDCAQAHVNALLAEPGKLQG